MLDVFKLQNRVFREVVAVVVVIAVPVWDDFTKFDIL